MVGATLLQSVVHLPGIATIGSAFGGIPHGLPNFAVPKLAVSEMLTLIGPAFTIAMLGAIESLLSAVVADGMSGTRHDSNQELIGQGLANIVVPMFGGFAATGAIARTATNIRNGANSPLAGVVHATTLVATLLFLAPLASSIPLAALAAILVVVAWNMSEAKHLAFILRKAPTADRVILVITFALTGFVRHWWWRSMSASSSRCCTSCAACRKWWIHKRSMPVPSRTNSKLKACQICRPACWSMQ